MNKRAGSEKKPSSSNQRSNNHHPSHEHIAIRAYEIYVKRGAEHGRDLDDWLQAERELTAKTGNSNSGRRQVLAI
ncbi:MAG TPA: DUF2934 domain-containing protein [Candidatus Acidoferrales bacterium]|jgi:hypothetical protein|nr:DUF2934 domain-containing protein [Candidatus Acidoferrales bacterium]